MRRESGEGGGEYSEDGRGQDGEVSVSRVGS